MVGTACAQHRAFPRELLPENYSRVLPGDSVKDLRCFFAPKVRILRIAGGTAEAVLRPDTDDGLFFYQLPAIRKEKL